MSPGTATAVIGFLVVIITGIVVVAVRTNRASKVEPVTDERIRAAARGWRPPPELQTSLPRDVHLTRQAIALVTLFAVMALGILVGGGFGYRAALREHRVAEMLNRSGLVARASVTDKAVRPNGKSSRHVISYTFVANGGRISGSADVPGRLYNATRVGGTVDVLYAPDDPRVHRVVGREAPLPPWAALLFVFALAGVIAAIPLLIRSQMRLVAYGTPAAAVVERVSPTKGGSAVRYRFLSQDGDVTMGATTVPSKEKPAAGDTVTIVYDPDRPRSNRLYPMQMVRVRSVS
ncbi:MAG TPA: DUF3592 domain-containing protein [Gemmatimonadaceae bacterium]|nr:DUF3592 domain-containing protein [Gemmatimonadaceae bacterium]